MTKKKSNIFFKSKITTPLKTSFKTILTGFSTPLIIIEKI